MNFHEINLLDEIDDFYQNVKKSLKLRDRCIISGENGDQRFVLLSQEEIKELFKKYQIYSELN